MQKHVRCEAKVDERQFDGEAQVLPEECQRQTEPVDDAKVRKGKGDNLSLLHFFVTYVTASVPSAFATHMIKKHLTSTERNNTHTHTHTHTHTDRGQLTPQNTSLGP